jgi:epoxyqueuosine reductase
VKVFVDTAPVMEKPLAMRAGLGWQGKHTNLVSRDFGSWLFLGSVFTTLDLPPDDTEADHCGACTACLDICPTNAFPAPYKIDARRCISYLTIEHKGMIERELRPLMGNHIYGCDDCLAACPWNKFAQKAEETKLALQSDYDRPDLIALSKLDDAAFRIFFAGTPIKRAGRDNFIRNVLMALGNMDIPTPAHIAAVRARLEDEAELVRASAIWALGQMTDMSGAEILNMVGARGPLVDEELAQLGN